MGNSLRVQRGNLKSLNVADSSVEPIGRKVGTAETDGCPLALPPLAKGLFKEDVCNSQVL